MINANEEENMAIIKPEADITSSTVGDLRENILLQLQENKINITIDLENVDVIDSIGLGVLISCYKALLELGGKLSFISASEDLMLMFKVLKLDNYFSITSKV